jgi:hypothetical protein
MFEVIVIVPVPELRAKSEWQPLQSAPSPGEPVFAAGGGSGVIKRRKLMQNNANTPNTIIFDL